MQAVRENRETKEEALRKTLGIYTSNELRESKRELPPDVVEGLIPDHKVTVLTGPKSLGKSYMLLEMAHHIACGDPWLGLDTEEQRVLFIDVENGEVLDAERIRRIKHETDDVHLKFDKSFGLNGEDVALNLDNDSSVEQLRDIISRFDYGLVVIDSLVDFLHGMDTDDNPTMAAVVQTLGALAQSEEAAILVIHHPPKATAGTPYQTARGAGSLAQCADCSMQVTRPRDSSLVRIWHDKARQWSQKDFKVWLCWDDEEGTFSTIRSTGDTNHDALLRCLSDNQWHKASEVCKEAARLLGKVDRTARNALGDLLDSGSVLRDEGEHGDWGRSYGIKLA